MTTKGVVFFGVFDAIDAMVLLLSPEQIELEGCACTQIKALEEWNGLIYPDNALDLTERDRIAANTKRNKKDSKNRKITHKKV